MVLRYSLVAATVWLLSSDLLEFRLLSSKKKKRGLSYSYDFFIRGM